MLPDIIIHSYEPKTFLFIKIVLYTEVAETALEFHELAQAQIRAYHSHFGPLDKAGAYAIRKGGSLIVKRIEGCY